jgi:hypothetical protein
MISLGFALALAVTASVALNVSYLLQRAGTRDGPALDARRPLRSMRVLLGSGAWRAGLIFGLTGWGLYVLALAHAPLSLVQAFAAGGLALVVPAAAVFLGERATRADRFAVGATIVALLLLGAGAVRSHPLSVPAGRMSAFLALAAAAALVAPRVRSGARGRVLAAAAGILYGAADAATKAVAIAAHGGLRGALIGPWGFAVVAASAGAFVLFQRGLQLGPAVRVIALMTVGTNVTAMAGGLLVFGEPLGRTAPLALLHGAGLAAAALSSLGLGATQARLAARAEAGRRPAHRPRRAVARLLRAVATWITVALAVVAGMGWLDLLRRAGALALGPAVAGALPLEQLAHRDAQPLLRFAVAWIPAGAAATVALAAGTRTPRIRRGVGVGLAGWVILVIAGALSDAAALNTSVVAELRAQPARPATWVAAALLAAGALAVPSRLLASGPPAGRDARPRGRRAQDRPRWWPTSRSAIGASRRQRAQSWPPA